MLLQACLDVIRFEHSEHLEVPFELSVVALGIGAKLKQFGFRHEGTPKRLAHRFPLDGNSRQCTGRIAGERDVGILNSR